MDSYHIHEDLASDDEDCVIDGDCETAASSVPASARIPRTKMTTMMRILC